MEFGSTSHYALATYYNEFSAKVLYDTVSMRIICSPLTFLMQTYQRLHKCGTNPEGQLIPCHFTNQSDAVTFFGLTPDEMEVRMVDTGSRVTELSSNNFHGELCDLHIVIAGTTGCRNHPCCLCWISSLASDEKIW